MTPAFRESHSEVTSIIEAFLDGGSKWTLLGGLEAYKKAVEDAKKHKEPSRVFMLKKRSETVPGQTRDWRVYDVKTFLKSSIVSVDAEGSRMGACAR